MPTDFLGRVMVVFNRYGMSMLQGAGVSLKIALVGTLVGCLIGFAVGIVQTIPSEKGDNPLKKGALWIIRLILNAYVEFFRGTPMMAQAMFIYYGLMPLLGINSTITQAAYFILSIIVYGCEKNHITQYREMQIINKKTNQPNHRVTDKIRIPFPHESFQEVLYIPLQYRNTSHQNHPYTTDLPHLSYCRQRTSS